MLDRATTLTLIEASISKPWHDSMEPLLEFVKVMGGQEGSFALPSKDAAEEFANLSYILQATEESPMKVIRALKAIDETASAEKMVLATFKALPQGTKLIELARDFASCSRLSIPFRKLMLSRLIVLLTWRCLRTASTKMAVSTNQRI